MEKNVYYIVKLYNVNKPNISFFLGKSLDTLCPIPESNEKDAIRFKSCNEAKEAIYNFIQLLVNTHDIHFEIYKQYSPVLVEVISRITKHNNKVYSWRVEVK